MLRCSEPLPGEGAERGDKTKDVSTQYLSKNTQSCYCGSLIHSKATVGT